jgi:outer membrane protein
MAAADRYNILLDQVNAFAESFRAAEVRFDAGVGTSIDYLIAKNNLDRANSSLVSARYDLVLRKKILEYYEGGQVFVK